MSLSSSPVVQSETNAPLLLPKMGHTEWKTVFGVTVVSKWASIISLAELKKLHFVHETHSTKDNVADQNFWLEFQGEMFLS